MRTLAISAMLLIALPSSATALAGQWISDTINGEPGMRYDGPNFGVVLSCNEFRNFDARLITDKGMFTEQWGGLLRTGSLVVTKDQAAIVRRNAYREDDMAHLAVFAAVLLEEHVLSAAEAAGKIEFTLVEGEDQISFIATTSADGFEKNSAELVEQCHNKYSR